MKTTLTKADPVGNYLCDWSAITLTGHQDESDVLRFWNGSALSYGQNGQHCHQLENYTNFRLLVEAPAEHFTTKQRAEQFFTEFAAVKSLRQLARDVHEACDKAGVPTHSPKMARAALAEPLSVRDRLSHIVTLCHTHAQSVAAKDGILRRLNDEARRLQSQVDDVNSECHKREGELSAIGRLVLPLAGETIVNAVVRKLDLLNQLLEAIKPEGDAVGTIKALRAQRDQLRREVAVRDSESLRLREKIEACRKELQHVRTVANELQGVIDRNIKIAA